MTKDSPSTRQGVDPMNKANPDALLELAVKLWEEAEIRRLSSPWTSPTRFEGDVREHYIARARAQQVKQ